MRYITPRKAARGLGAAGPSTGTAQHWSMTVTSVALLILTPAFIFVVASALGLPHHGVFAYFSRPYPAIVTALFLIVQGHPTPWMAFWAAVIVGREIAVSALREWMAELGQRATVRVAAIGKFKTVVQMVALLCLLYSVTPDRPARATPWMGELVFHIGDWLLAAAALLTLWSGMLYLRAAWPVLMESEQKGVQKGVDTSRSQVRISSPPRE